MKVLNIPYQSIPGISKAFLHAHTLTEPAEMFQKSRASLLGPSSANIISDSMSGLKLTPLQQRYVDDLSSGNAFVIITGQQPGFLGGPLYSLYKAMSCIALVESRSHADRQVVPVFWIEDNDHDGMEAGIATIIDTQGALHSIQCDSLENLQSRISISERTFSDDIDSVIDHVASLLPTSEYGSAMVNELKEIYRSGVSWSEAFLCFMNKRLGEFGMLFLLASKARKAGLFADIMHKEICHPGELKSLVDKANEELLQEGSIIQAEAGIINAFYHDETGRRIKVEYAENDGFLIGSKTFTRNEFEEYWSDNKASFSPNVLLRPIVQDSILPTIGMVVGPGELQYMMQLQKAYSHHELPMPMLYPRHSCTIISQSISKYLLKYGLTADSFMKSINDIEKELTERFANDESGDHLFEKMRSDLHETMHSISKHASTIDASLQGAVLAAEHGIEKQLDGLHKKITSVLKKKQEQLFIKAKEAHEWIYPNNHLQERVLGSVSIEAKIGESAMKDALLSIKEAERGEHIVLFP